MTEEVDVEDRTAHEPRRIVVGYDGSPVSQAAVAYAARRAGAGGELVIAHAYSPPAEWRGTAEWERSVHHQHEYGRRLLDELPKDVLGGVRFEEELVEGAPAQSLVGIAAARDAEEIIVGSRASGPSVPRSAACRTRCCTRRTCPSSSSRPAMLVTVPDARTAHLIVVGYMTARPRRRTPLSHAAYRAGPDGSLIVVHAYASPFGYSDTPFFDEAAHDAGVRAEATLAEIGSDVVGAVPVERVTAESPSADALVQVARSKRADEIVVGSRGLGRFRAALGSVSHAVLHEADRPVVVVPHAPTAAERDLEERAQLARRVRRVPLRL